MAGGMTSVAAVPNSLIFESRHQREAFEIVIPELRLAAETAQLDHRQREIKTVFLGLERDFLVEFEAGLILRGVLRNEPAIVADGNEDADFHSRTSCFELPQIERAGCD
jgi:hypothetical protein